MEPLRVFAVQAQQQAEHTVYEGQPYRPWENPHRHSLPPAPDRPKKKPAKVRREVATSEQAALRANLVAQLLAQGKSTKSIAESLGLKDCQSVYNIKSKLKRAGVPVAKEFEVERAQPTPAPAPAITPACLSREPEPPRVHVIDWERRMSCYQFEGPPEQLKPKSARRRIKSMTPAQLRDELRGHTRMTASQINPGRAINCAAEDTARTNARTRSRSPFD